MYRADDAPMLTGLASMIELHYTTTLQDADQIGSVVDTTLLEFSNGRNRSDVLNLTAGFHFEFARDTAFRVAGVFPLREDPDRDFDAEFVAQVVHRFGSVQSRARPTNSSPMLGSWNPLGALLSKISFVRSPKRCMCRRCQQRRQQQVR